MAAPITFHGALFDSNTPVTPAIAKAANVAKTYGLALVKARTPVDTSKLKGAWAATLEGNGIRWTNPTPYAGFVEHGTRKMAGRAMLANSLTDIETVFYRELSKELGKTLAFDIIDTSSPPTYGNSVKPSAKYPEVGKNVAPKVSGGLSRRKGSYSKSYLFSNPKDIVGNSDKDYVNSQRPLFQKYERKFTPEFKMRGK